MIIQGRPTFKIPIQKIPDNKPPYNVYITRGWLKGNPEHRQSKTRFGKILLNNNTKSENQHYPVNLKSMKIYMDHIQKGSTTQILYNSEIPCTSSRHRLSLYPNPWHIWIAHYILLYIFKCPVKSISKRLKFM